MRHAHTKNLLNEMIDLFLVVSIFLLFYDHTAFRKQPPSRPNVIQHDEQDNLDIDFRGKMIISSGKLTYRIPSPTRPSRSLNKNSFQVSVVPTSIAKIIRKILIHSHFICGTIESG